VEGLVNRYAYDIMGPVLLNAVSAKTAPMHTLNDMGLWLGWRLRLCMIELRLGLGFLDL